MAERRRAALLIGNNDYEHDKLLNCVNDVNDLASVLKEIGFIVQLEENLRYEDMERRIKHFLEFIEENDFILFFFAGHGQQWEDQNYLIPCDNNITNCIELKTRAVRAQHILEQMSSKKPHVIVCFLDCCREYSVPNMARGRGGTNPSKGMCQMRAVAGSMIVFACAPGTTAKDMASNGRNGVFTYHLLQHIGKPNENILMLTVDVTNGVESETNGEQIPTTTHNLRDGNIFITSSSRIVSASATTTIDVTQTAIQSSIVQNNIPAATTINVVNSSITCINEQISIMEISSQIQRVIPNLPANTRWEQQGVTIAGGNGEGRNNNQLSHPSGLFVDDDDDQTIFIADTHNHRIMQWKKGDTQGQVVAGGNGRGNRLDQLTLPTDVLINKETNSLIIADLGNRRVVRWSRRSGTRQGEILIENIKCYGLAMDEQRHLYVSDIEKNEVKRYQIDRGDRTGTLVAGGNRQGNALNQLHLPVYLFVDRNQSLYVSDFYNHRVMKWDKGAVQGVVIAGGQGNGTALTQLSRPNGIFVDTFGTLYVAEGGPNQRVTRWLQESEKKGTVVVGGNGAGSEANQLNLPVGLSFDKHGNLYVVDNSNHRVQRFNLII